MYECVTKETEVHVRKRWMRVWDRLDEKERKMNVIKCYVEVNNEVERETMRYIGEDGKTKELN